MSTHNPSFRAGTDAWRHSAPETLKPSAGDDTTVLRGQAREIVYDVLADSSPAPAAVREQLRQHVAAHPGRPERALLEHLSALKPDRPGTTDPGPSDPASSMQPSQVEDQRPRSERLAGRSRLEAVLRDRMLVTAFQPIYDLVSGTVIGAEALTRFVSDGGDPAEYWFAQAQDTGLGTDLEFAALESALTASSELPSHVFVALKLSRAACLDARLPVLMDQSSLDPVRMVLELSGRFSADQADSLDVALSPLRGAGVRLSIDHSGSYFTSIRHVLGLRPEIIKLDPCLSAGIDQDSLRQELVAAEVAFARQVGATLSAQRIETVAELATVTGLGVTLGRGYYLGWPSVQPRDWALWQDAEPLTLSPAGPNGAVNTVS